MWNMIPILPIVHTHVDVLLHVDVLDVLAFVFVLHPLDTGHVTVRVRVYCSTSTRIRACGV